MNQTDFIKEVSKFSNVKKSDVAEVVSTMMSVIILTVVEEKGEVFLPGFGRFKLSLHKERRGRNPHTGEPQIIPASYVPKFVAAKKFKEAAAKLATPSETGVDTAAP